MASTSQKKRIAVVVPGAGAARDAPVRPNLPSTPLVDDEFNRPPRIHRHLPSGEIEIPPPPDAREEASDNTVLAILVSSGGMLAFGLVYALSGSGLALGLLLMPLFLIGGQMYLQRIQQRRYKARELDRVRRYQSTLESIRSRLEALRSEQQLVHRDNDPPLSELQNRVHQRDTRLWERRPTDPDFLCLRIGIGKRPSSVTIKMPPETAESPLLDAAVALGREYKITPDVPLTADLPSVGSLGVAGPRDEVVALVRSLLCQLAVNHSPRDVKVVAFLPSPTLDQMRQDWDWLKWLPHIRRDNDSWLVALDDKAAEEQMGWLLDQLSKRAEQRTRTGSDGGGPEYPYLLLLLDKANDQRVRDQVAFAQVLTRGRELRASAICLLDDPKDVPGECGAIAEVMSDGTLRYSVAGPDGYITAGIADNASADPCEDIAVTLSPLTMVTSEGQGDLPTGVRLLDLLWPDMNVTADKVDPQDWWERSRRDFTARAGWLRVPLGELRKGDPMVVDLRGAGDERGGFQGIHDGPHGLIAGTSGSGKSELLQTLITALALTHHPNAVNFLLIDYKGGSSLEYFRDLPHTVGVVTNLSTSLAQRALVALKAELKRREELIVSQGKSDIAGYERQRVARGHGEQLADLFIMVDEFAELVTNLPNFIEQLISVGRLGRSLGVHLILATQKPGGSVSSNIQANINFRICLRVQSADDSRDMINRPDAAYISNATPGRAFYMLGSDRFDSFQAARVAEAFGFRDANSGKELILQPFYIDRLQPGASSWNEKDGSAALVEITSPPVTGTEMEEIVKRLIHLSQELKITPSRRPYPPPLPTHITLAEALRRQGGKEGLNQIAEQLEAFGPVAQGRPPADWHWDPAVESRWMQAIIGILDEPSKQAQPPLNINLAQSGNLMVVGASGSGKTTLLRTLAITLAITYTPDQLWFYFIDFGGGLDSLRGLPHTGDVLTARASEKIKRLLRRLNDEIDERKQLFAHEQVNDLSAYRAKGLPTLPAIVVMIDNFASFRQSYENDMDSIAAVMREGRAYGIHIVVAADRSAAIPRNISSSMGERLSLRVSEDSDSMMVIDKDWAADLAVEQAGRGYRRTATLPLEFQTALCFANAEGIELDEVTRQLIDAMKQSWQDREGKCADEIKLLSQVIPLRELVPIDAANAWTAPVVDGLVSVVGRDDYHLEPIHVNLSRQGPSFLITGAAESGRTTLLISWVLSLAERYSPEAMRCYLVDFKRRGVRLSALADLPHVSPVTVGDRLSRHVSNPEQMEALVQQLEQELAQRKKLTTDDGGNDARPADVADLVVVIDDYEYMLNDMDWATSAIKNTLAPIVARSGNFGIHFLVAGTLTDLRYSDPLIVKLKSLRSGVLLRVNDTAGADLFGINMHQPPTDFVAGRGYFVQGNAARLMQAPWIANGEGPDAVGSWVARLAARARE